MAASTPEFNADGVSSAGTRIALSVKTLAPSVMVLTSTDSAGAGPFTPGAATTIHNGGMAVYEVLYGDPFEIEYADIEFTVAPASAGMATPTLANPAPTAIPRFSTADSTVVTVADSLIGILLPIY
jgi:hypothetical protein